jgi:hypothetical protein
VVSWPASGNDRYPYHLHEHFDSCLRWVYETYIGSARPIGLPATTSAIDVAFEDARWQNASKCYGCIELLDHDEPRTRITRDIDANNHSGRGERFQWCLQRYNSRYIRVLWRADAALPNQTSTRSARQYDKGGAFLIARNNTLRKCYLSLRAGHAPFLASPVVFFTSSG